MTQEQIDRLKSLRTYASEIGFRKSDKDCLILYKTLCDLEAAEKKISDLTANYSILERQFTEVKR